MQTTQLTNQNSKQEHVTSVNNVKTHASKSGLVLV